GPLRGHRISSGRSRLVGLWGVGRGAGENDAYQASRQEQPLHGASSRTGPTVLSRAKHPAREIQARLVLIAFKAFKADGDNRPARDPLSGEMVSASPQEADFAGTGLAAGTSPSAEM